MLSIKKNITFCHSNFKLISINNKILDKFCLRVSPRSKMNQLITEEISVTHGSRSGREIQSFNAVAKVMRSGSYSLKKSFNILFF